MAIPAGAAEADGSSPPVFSDVPAGHVFEVPVAWMASEGITLGRGDGSFGLNDVVTRGAMAAFLYRYDGEPEVDLPERPDPVSDWPWTQVEQQGGLVTETGADMTTVTTFDGGLVAVGYEFLDAGFTRVAAAWTSTDGQQWSRASVDLERSSGTGQYGDQTGDVARMDDVIAGGPGLIAVGRVGSGDYPVPAIWTSTDGQEWTLNDTIPFDGAMQAVTATDDGYVAVGYVGFEFPLRAQVWVSDDGLSWRAVDSDDVSVFGGPGEQGTFTDQLGRVFLDVAVGGPGLVAVGSETQYPEPLSEEPIVRGRIWTSTDGENWSMVPHDGDLFGSPVDGAAEILTVSSSGDGLVAAGVVNGDAAVWTSSDGVSWTRVPHDAATFGGEGFQAIYDVVDTGDGLVAVGFDDARYAPATWHSPDAAAWQRVAPDSIVNDLATWQAMWSVTARGDELIAVGYDAGAPAVWTWRR